MTMTRRRFVRGAAGLVAGGAFARFQTVVPAADVGGLPKPHYVILLTLRGGFDSVLSLNPQDPSVVGEAVSCGYLADERIRGPRRMFGPLIGGLQRHDENLCLVHGVRSDTTSHPDGLAMLARGRRRARSRTFADILGSVLPGDAPLRTLGLVAGDGVPIVAEAERPAWADLRSDLHREQAVALRQSGRAGPFLEKGTVTARRLGRFLDEAASDAGHLDTRFASDLGPHLRLAFQAVRGNWARCIEVATRGLWFDSHSDNMRFQRLRQPDTWADVAMLIDLLESTRNEHGSLFEQTTIAVFSEFGRFPRLNGEQGKDHFPENSWVLAGRGVNGGMTVGATDAVGKGVRVDFRTGLAGGDQARPIFIDNTFASLVAIAGGDLPSHGYEPDSVMGCMVSEL